MLGLSLAHQGYREASITPRIIDGSVRVFMISKPIGGVSIIVAGQRRLAQPSGGSGPQLGYRPLHLKAVVVVLGHVDMESLAHCRQTMVQSDFMTGSVLS